MGKRLKKLFHWQPGRAEFLSPLRKLSRPDLPLERFQIGIDNTHIDIFLSPKISATASELVRRIVNEDLARNNWGEVGPEASSKDFDAFRDAYSGLMEVVVERVHDRAAATEVIQLLHISLLKLLLELPGQEIKRLRHQLQQDSSNFSPQLAGRSLELHERAVALAKLEPGVTYRTLRRLFKVVQRQESTSLRKMRKSVLGASWMVPKLALFNPLLHLPSLTSEEYFMNHYPLLCMDNGEQNFFALTNQIVCDLFESYLPEWAAAADELSERNIPQGLRIKERDTGEGISGFLEGQRLLEQSLQDEEFMVPRTSWLDVPDNIERLIQPVGGNWLFGSMNKSPQPNAPWHDKNWPEFQQRLASELFRRCLRADITRRAVASYRAPRLYRQLEGRIPVKEVYQYLAGVIPKRKLVRRLSALPQSESSNDMVKALDMVSNHIRRMSTAKQQEYVVRYIRDFLGFRRDLKLAYFVNRAMARLKLLTSPEDIKLSKDNGSLYDYPLRTEVEPDEQKIQAHVIMKADLRGSTEITKQLLTKRLNPATHFSMNFFGPITKLLSDFGAQKVFVEGDALILTILEYEGASPQWMSVANSCGMARKILSVMDTQNTQNRMHNLPELELGLGIAFSDDAPAYLYDERRKIMISPAINQADRLSSCSAELKRNLQWARHKGHRVEVMTEPGQDSEAGRLLRYNVNGIELDSPAFFKLKSELALHKVRLRDREGDSHYYHVGRYLDRHGTTHWLVVREAPVLLWQGDVTAGPEPLGRHFFEVVTEPKLVARVKSKLSSKHKDSRSGRQTDSVG
ncbi:MAG: hypothetical protein JMN24_16525 [gamma proteobacterium endosymbiont of Lamellibrachia anaximandri]|nr:hypothetical protein [gamma proteobacterium endosymbiont of Lamellibrachia anaximandri]MBL3617797.1 hypothetical protein [gamma proteobacterium endosymbiont of Lamellibrachia anaximandri]